MTAKLIAFLLFSTSLMALEGPGQKALRAFEKKDYSDAVKYAKEWVTSASPDKLGEAYKLLAESYYKDQEHEKAYTAFFQALAHTAPPQAPYKLLPEDEKMYKEGLAIYLEPSQRDPDAVALQLRDLYGGIIRLHPDYLELGYLVAVSYANLGEMERFFELFYHSYQQLPDHYLSYKSQAILHVKLMERAKTPEDKEQQRVLVLQDLQLAKERFPMDTSIYRMQIAFANPEDREAILKRNLKEIIDQSIVIPRVDLSFYFDQLFAYREKELALELLTKARGWYPYSRTLDSVKQMLEENK
jgi:tetratricopeptide (TPR) repeat protein